MTLDEETVAILRGFAHSLVKPRQKTRMFVLKEAVPELSLAPGDGVVYAAGRAAAGGRWLVLKAAEPHRKPRFTLDTAPLARRVCGRVLFTIREYDETTGEETDVR